MNRTLLFMSLFFAFAGCKKKNNSDVIDPLPKSKVSTTFLKVGANKPFSRVCFPTETTGYIANIEGDIYKTTNVGTTWSALTVPSKSPIYDLYFFNANEGFAVGGESDCGGTGCVPSGASMLYTKDGGANWSVIALSLSQKIQIRSMVFLNDSIGFAVGGSLIMSTKDRGKTWKETKIENLQGSMLDIAFHDAQNGLIACAFDKVVKTSDGGSHWEVLNPFSTTTSYSVAWTSSKAFVSGNNRINVSSNSGASWLEVAKSPLNIFKLVFTTDKTGYAFGCGTYSGGDWGVYYGSFYATEDGGTTWQGQEDVKEMNVIEDASFPSTRIGFAVGGPSVMRIEIP